MSQAASTCQRCGTAVLAGARFCPICGADVSGLQGAVATEMVSTLEGAGPFAGADHLVAQLRQATLGEYEILAKLGEGGMATVYLAHDIALDRKVAIKVMSPALLVGEGMIERFKREARTAAALSHPYIIPIYAVRDQGKLLYFVMKYVEGRPLDSIISDTGALPPRMVQTIMSQVGPALGQAHRKGIIHRDIKPSNIMVDTDGYAVVTDFGIAKATQAEGLTQTGATVGTPTYMSPEQCSGRPVTGRSDQYSLGIVAYEMLTGRPPFTGDTVMSLMWAQVHEPPPPLSEAAPACPPELAAAVMRMIEKDPERRWPSVEAAADAINAVPLARDDSIRTQMIALATERLTPIPLPPTPTSPAPLSRSVRVPAPAAQVPTRAEDRPRRGMWIGAGTLVSVGALAAYWFLGRAPHATGAGPDSLAVKSPVAAESTARGTAPPPAATGQLRAVAVDLSPRDTSVAVDAAFRLAARVTGDRGVTLAGRELRWRSSNPQVALVDSLTGVIRGRRTGRVDVSARTSEGISATAHVTVIPPRATVARVQFEAVRDSLNIGDTLRVRAVVLDSRGGQTRDWTVGWRSDNPAVAFVDESGKLTALKEGTTRITATADTVNATKSFSVLAPRAAVAAVTPVSRDSTPDKKEAAAPPPAAGSNDATLAEVSTGGNSSCAVLEAGQAFCWGSDPPSGTKAAGMTLKKLSVGDGFACGITPAGEAYCWGGNAQGQLGDGSTTDRANPVAVSVKQSFEDITAGTSHACGLTGDGAAYCWGSNRSGQIGDGSKSNRSRPVKVIGSHSFQSISAGALHTCGITRENKAFCWGDGFSNQLGNGKTGTVLEPDAVNGTLQYRLVAVGARHSCGLTTLGRVYCWGENKHGQLGNDTNDDRNQPDSVYTDQLFRGLTAGGTHTCGLTTRGQILCWGDNSSGQLGEGSRRGRVVPGLIQATQSFQKVSAGGAHTCALSTTGQVLCWGANGKGQLGTQTSAQLSPTPAAIRIVPKP